MLPRGRRRLAVPRVLGGRGTYLPRFWAGSRDAALRAGDILKIGPAAAWAKRFTATLAGAEAMPAARWEIGAAVRPKYATAPVVRAMRGPQWKPFDAEAQARFHRRAVCGGCAAPIAWV